MNSSNPTGPFETAVDFILDVESGLVGDPSDPGGLTKFGISQRAYPNLNIRDLTIEGAKALYRKDYRNLCSCDKFRPELLLFSLMQQSIKVSANRFGSFRRL